MIILCLLFQVMGSNSDWPVMLNACHGCKTSAKSSRVDNHPLRWQRSGYQRWDKTAQHCTLDKCARPTYLCRMLHITRGLLLRLRAYSSCGFYNSPCDTLPNRIIQVNIVLALTIQFEPTFDLTSRLHVIVTLHTWCHWIFFHWIWKALRAQLLHQMKMEMNGKIINL